MPVYTSSDGASGLLPADYGALVTRPVEAESVAMRVSSVQRTGANEYHVPVVVDDPASAWVPEGGEITPDDPEFEELIVVPRKVGGLVVVSREMADDSSPGAADVIGRGLARSIVIRIDQAYFGALALPAPPGLGSLGTAVTTVDAPASFADMDPFAEAISKAEGVGAQLDHFVLNPADLLELAQVKESSGSARPLLGADASTAGDRRILGVPVLVSPAVAAGVAWGIPAEHSIAVLRDDVRVERSEHPFFTSDRIAVRATLRTCFAFPHPQAVVRIVKA